ncbi:MAG: N-6 DNA methylase, partial [Akkermansiaceae bacterium]
MPTLSTPHRRLLETAVKHARKISAGGARKSLEALAVHEPDPYRHMDESQRVLRRKLRAQAKQLGDGESHAKRGSYEISHLVEKLAYDQWHRILFARYLLENDLLISPDHGVAVSLDDCEELAPSQGLKDAWAVAARFAAVELPEIFRSDDPAGAVELPVEDRKPLIALVTGLPVDVFTATDSLGWCYQFWQADKKDEVNAAGNKIGADELPSVTQLFTEDYMVDFLLDNTLGAWHAAKESGRLAHIPSTEAEARAAVALPGCAWKYLRFTSAEEGGQDAHTPWSPAAGTFPGWPKTAAALKCLDPCMGSGHFVVAMFERLVALRMAEENLDAPAAVAAVIRDNLFGLEIDPRCTQIAAFNLALAAWRRVGHCKLPPMNLACSGLAPNTREADWLALAGDDEKLQRGMARLYRLFQNAPVLGSLINPRADKGDLLVAAFHELQPLLEQALAQETQDDSAHEMAVTAQGIAKAAEILAGEFTLVATNVPYLGRGKQSELLQDYCERVHPEAKADLATCFVERCLDVCGEWGSTALVTPQNWLFLGTYKKLRKRLLEGVQWNGVARLGPHAFETIGGEVVSVALLELTRRNPSELQAFFGYDATVQITPSSKADKLHNDSFIEVEQAGQLANPDARIVFDFDSDAILLAQYAQASQGIPTSDGPLFVRKFWDLPSLNDGWEFHQGTVLQTMPYGGREDIILFEGGRGRLRRMSAEQERDRRRDFQGANAWGRLGIAVSLMSELSCTLYTGEKFDNNVSAVVPRETTVIPGLWAYCTSNEFAERVRQIDQKLNVTNATLVKVPFDLAHWQKVAAEKYPGGL